MLKLRVEPARSLLALAVLTGLNSLPVMAQADTSEDDLEHISVVKQRQAYRGDVPLKELPQSIDIISETMLDDMGIIDLQSALKFTSGISNQNNFGGLWDSFAIRGFAGDGNRPSGYLVNGFNTGRGFTGKRDASSIQSIEVLKGPGSALYGRGEPGGTINIITKKPAFTEEGYVEATVGSYDLYRVEGDYTNAVTADIAFRANGAYEDAGSFRDKLSSEKLFFTPSVVYQLDENTSFFYELEVIDQQALYDRGIPILDGQFGLVPIETFYGEPSDGPMTIEGIAHQLSMQSRINDEWSINGGVSYRDSSFEGYSTEPEVAPGRQQLLIDGETLSRQRRFRDYDTTDLSGRVELSGELTAGNFTHHILLGADAYDYEYHQTLNRWRTTADDTTYNVDYLNPRYGLSSPADAPLSLATDVLEDQQAYGVYIQDQIDVSASFKFLLGVRFDDFSLDSHNLRSDVVTSQDRSATSPRLGAVYVPNSNYSLYVSYSEGFRPNSGADINGNSFEPEESKSYEGGVKFSTENESVTGTIAVFHAEKSNILSVDPVSGASFAIGEVESEGVEIDLNAALGDATMLTVSYAYIDAANQNPIVSPDWWIEIPAGTPLVNVPENSLNITVNHQLIIGGYQTSLNAGLTYVDERLGDAVDPSYILPGYTTVDVAGTVELTPALTARLVIDNLFDREYYDNSYSALWTQPGKPRMARLSVKYAF